MKGEHNVLKIFEQLSLERLKYWKFPPRFIEMSRQVYLSTLYAEILFNNNPECIQFETIIEWIEQWKEDGYKGGRQSDQFGMEESHYMLWGVDALSRTIVPSL